MIAKSFSSTFIGLPDELLIQIFTLLPSLRDLSSLSLVSRRFNAVADPVLYKSILFDQPRHHLIFSQSLATRPRRGSIIQNVRLDYPSSELSGLMQLKNGSDRIDGFSHAISTMSNLENLLVSVPESLSHGIGTLFNGPFDLACLKTCKFQYYKWSRAILRVDRLPVLPDRRWRILGSPGEHSHFQPSYFGHSHYSEGKAGPERF